jgi:hypothetical protein
VRLSLRRPSIVTHTGQVVRPSCDTKSRSISALKAQSGHLSDVVCSVVDSFSFWPALEAAQVLSEVILRLDFLEQVGHTNEMLCYLPSVSSRAVSLPFAPRCKEADGARRRDIDDVPGNT